MWFENVLVTRRHFTLNPPEPGSVLSFPRKADSGQDLANGPALQLEGADKESVFRRAGIRRRMGEDH